MRPDNLYRLLGVPENATQSEIEEAFRKWKSVYDPETHPNPPRGAELAKEITEAYFVLHNPERRKEYDRQLRKKEGTHRQKTTSQIGAKQATGVALLALGAWLLFTAAVASWDYGGLPESGDLLLPVLAALLLGSGYYFAKSD